MSKKNPEMSVDISTNHKPETEYEQIWSLQEAINKAIATGKVVRYKSRKSNKELKKEVTDLKGCKVLKPSADSEDIAAVPPHIKNFDFNTVDTSLWLPGDKWRD